MQYEVLAVTLVAQSPPNLGGDWAHRYIGPHFGQLWSNNVNWFKFREVFACQAKIVPANRVAVPAP